MKKEETQMWLLVTTVIKVLWGKFLKLLPILRFGEVTVLDISGLNDIKVNGDSKVKHPEECLEPGKGTYNKEYKLLGVVEYSLEERTELESYSFLINCFWKRYKIILKC